MRGSSGTPSIFQMGNRHRETSNTSQIYVNSREECLNAMKSGGLINQAKAVSLFMKRMDHVGRLFWRHDDSSEKTINITLVDDDIYELDEKFDIELSLFHHPNPEFNPTIIEQKQYATIWIDGPNDCMLYIYIENFNCQRNWRVFVFSFRIFKLQISNIAKLGSIGFEEVLYRIEEGTDFCIPFARVGGSDENVYLSYHCQEETALSVESAHTVGKTPDFEWKSPARGFIMWTHGESGIKCVNIKTFKDFEYEDDESITCTVTKIWTDFDHLIPAELEMSCGVIIAYNDGMIISTYIVYSI